MKKYINLVFLFAISTNAFAGKSINVNIVRSLNGVTQTKYVIPFSSSDIKFEKAVWRSPGGSECTVWLPPQSKSLPKGTFDCQTPPGKHFEIYKAEIAFDCSKNNSKDTSAYMFFGQLLGYPDSGGNFYVWCE